MSRNFTVTGAEALLAIAACERTSSLTGQTEIKPGYNVAFAYGAIGKLLPYEFAGEPDNTDSTLRVEVERLMTKPGVYRYQCTIQPDIKGVLN
ncbi:MAG TPA: hypothetical protein VFP26_00830 [Gemmatimonadaceae bacterium]|jgi:hypothetical protein|nr:hypothetical protein [Gemmatimonadaceae bacterium]